MDLERLERQISQPRNELGLLFEADQLWLVAEACGTEIGEQVTLPGCRRRPS